QKPKEFKIIILDNGAFHKAKTLQVPSNMYLLFLPPYSPELNPAEPLELNPKSSIGFNLLMTVNRFFCF
ncbi:MAG: transposase, partial [Phycisphaerales bacterium]|nr:transposase [Phycisphaerales bacterium]